MTLTIGQKIRRHRESVAGYGRTVFARHCGIAKVTLEKIEMGQTEAPSLKVAHKIVQGFRRLGLKVSLDDLMQE